ncbi:MAG: pseudouridine synthase [Bacteroidota bacterium]
MNKKLPIIYQDDYLVAVNKPHGLLVHRSWVAAHEKELALQKVRDQIGQRVFPIHRLDRKTSGVLLFALDKATAALVQAEFIHQRVVKKYIAIVRGFFPEAVEVDYPLTNDRNKTQEAITVFKKIQQVELDIPFGQFSTSRYSLIHAFPKTGRQHQIRKHLNHLRHPIIGDRPHGCNKQNKLFKEKWKMTTMLLHAAMLRFVHPASKENLILEAPFFAEFERMKRALGFVVS